MAKSKEDYTRAQWQIDAHGYWRSSGDRLVGKAELATAPTDKLQKLYRQFSRENVYSYEEHVELAKKLDRALDICMVEERKVVVTGRDTGATAQEFTDYVLDTIAKL